MRPSFEKFTHRTVPVWAFRTVDLPSLWISRPCLYNDNRGSTILHAPWHITRPHFYEAVTHTVGDHRRTVRSFDPDAMRECVGENATE